MAETLGQHDWAPDFMANVVVGLYDYRDELERNRPGFGQNAEGYYRFAREHDLVLTHALGDPQIDRSASAIDDPDLALRVVEERATASSSAVPSSWPRSRRCRTRFWCTSTASPPSATPSSS